MLRHRLRAGDTGRGRRRRGRRLIGAAGARGRAPIGQDRWRLARTLIIGTAGGVVFFALELPIAWMLGAMVFTTVASVGGADLALPSRLRSLFMTVLGVFLGSAFTPDILERIVRWPVSLGMLMISVTGVTALLYLYFRRRAGFDPVTAFFSATPGGMSEMVLVGGALGGDVRRIALVQACRVLLVVLTIPLLFRYIEGDAAVTAGQGLSVADAEAGEMLVLLACAVVGALGARVLRLPAGRMLGPMIASAAVHLSGLSHSPPPWELVAVAQVVIGSSVGCRFTNTPLMQILRIMAISVGATALMLASTAAFVLVATTLTGFAWQPVLLAYAPGGLAEMSLIALALGIETAFVATHHAFRIILIVFTAPLLFRWLGRSRPRAGQGD